MPDADLRVEAQYVFFCLSQAFSAMKGAMIYYNKSANGLRGLAALNVAILHFVGAFAPALLSKNFPSLFRENTDPGILFSIFQFPLFSLIYNGHFAVLVFFVLSGYVLTIPYFNHQTDALKSRLWGRYIRLNIPIAISILVSYALYQSNLYSNVAAGNISGSAWLKTFFPPTINASLATNAALYRSIVFGDATLNPPLWTLKIEFIGSVYLLTYYLCKPKTRAALATLAISALLYGIYRSESIYFIAILLGAMLNEVKLHKNAIRYCFAASLYFGAFQYKSPFFAFLPQLQYGDIELWNQKNFYNALGAFLLTASIVNGFGRAFLEMKFVQFLGRISFSLYLFHFLVLCSVSCALYLAMPRTPLFFAVNFACYLTACFVVASLVARFVDRPAIGIARRFSKLLFPECSATKTRPASPADAP